MPTEQDLLIEQLRESLRVADDAAATAEAGERKAARRASALAAENAACEREIEDLNARLAALRRQNGTTALPSGAGDGKAPAGGADALAQRLEGLATQLDAARGMAFSVLTSTVSTVASAGSDTKDIETLRRTMEDELLEIINVVRGEVEGVVQHSIQPSQGSTDGDLHRQLAAAQEEATKNRSRAKEYKGKLATLKAQLKKRKRGEQGDNERSPEEATATAIKHHNLLCSSVMKELERQRIQALTAIASRHTLPEIPMRMEAMLQPEPNESATATAVDEQGVVIKGAETTHEVDADLAHDSLEAPAQAITQADVDRMKDRFRVRVAKMRVYKEHTERQICELKRALVKEKRLKAAPPEEKPSNVDAQEERQRALRAEAKAAEFRTRLTAIVRAEHARSTYEPSPATRGERGSQEVAMAVLRGQLALVQEELARVRSQSPHDAAAPGGVLSQEQRELVSLRKELAQERATAEEMKSKAALYKKAAKKLKKQQSKSALGGDSCNIPTSISKGNESYRSPTKEQEINGGGPGVVPHGVVPDMGRLHRELQAAPPVAKAADGSTRAIDEARIAELVMRLESSKDDALRWRTKYSKLKEAVIEGAGGHPYPRYPT